MSKKRLFKILQIILPLFLGVFLIWFSYNKFTPEQIQEIKTYFKQADYRFVLISLLLGLASNLSRARRWNLLIQAMHYRPRFYNSVMAVYITYLMNLFIPRSGEISRAVVLSKYEEIPFDKVMGTVITERLIDALVLLVLILVTLYFQFPLLSEYFTSEIQLGAIYPWLLGGGLLGLLALYFIFIANSILSQKIRHFLRGLKEGVFSIFYMKKKWAFMAHTLFIWVMYIAMYYVMIFALEQTSQISAAGILCSFVAGGITITLTNSGFGSYPFVIASILVLFNIPETTGTAFGWLVWTTQTLSVIVLGGLSFLLLPVFNKTK